MGKQTSVIKFTGKLGNLAGYRRKGEHIVRTLPDKVRQTPATRRAAKDFGAISRQGKVIRQAIVPHLDIRYDGTLVNRLNRALILAGKDARPDVTERTHPATGSTPPSNARGLQVLTGFRFNPYTGISNIFGIPPVYTPDGVLELSAQILDPLGSATHLQVCALAVRINFTERRTVNVEEASAVIDLEQPFTGLKLPVTAAGKGTLFIVLQIQACISCNGSLYPLGDRRYMAADIVMVETPAAQKPAKSRNGRQHNPAIKHSNQGSHQSFRRGSYTGSSKLSHSPDLLSSAGMTTVPATAPPHIPHRE